MQPIDQSMWTASHPLHQATEGKSGASPLPHPQSPSVATSTMTQTQNSPRPLLWPLLKTMATTRAGVGVVECMQPRQSLCVKMTTVILDQGPCLPPHGATSEEWGEGCTPRMGRSRPTPIMALPTATMPTSESTLPHQRPPARILSMPRECVLLSRRLVSSPFTHAQVRKACSKTMCAELLMC